VNLKLFSDLSDLKRIYQLGILVFLLGIPFGIMAQLNQNYIVYKDGSLFKVKEELNNKIMISDQSALKAVQFAIDQAEGGGNVILSRGLYEINVPLKMKSGISVQGQGRGTEFQLSGSNKIVIEASNVQDITIKRVAITPGKGDRKSTTGMVINRSQNCMIEDVLIAGFKEYGIQIQNSSGFHVNRCQIMGNDKANIYLDDIDRGDASNLVQNTTFLWGGAAIKCRSGIGLEVTSSIVQEINGVPLDINCDDFSFTKSRVFLTESLEADLIVRGNGFRVSDNILTWGRGNGIVVDGGTNGIITANSIQDHGAPPRDSIFKSAVILRNGVRNNKVTANAIWNWDDWTQGPMLYGIEETEDCENDTITYNSIHFYKEEPILSQGKNTIIKNNVTDPGNDDGNLLPDFAVWREYVRRFIDDELLYSHSEETTAEDYVISKENQEYKVRTDITQKRVFTSKDASTAIQWAIDQTTRNGGSVELKEGVYDISKTILVKRNTWLHGQGDATILKTVEPMQTCVRLHHAPQSMISDLKVVRDSDVKTGIEIFDSTTGKVINVTVDGFTDYGIYFVIDTDVPPITWFNAAVSSLVTVQGNKILNSGKANILIPLSGAYVGCAVPMLIAGNTIIGGGIGIESRAICSNIVDNIVCNTSQSAIVMDQSSILTTGNITYNIGGSAIKCYDGLQDHYYHPTYDRQDNNNNKESTITNNWIINQRGHGVEISEQWGPIVGNIIQNSGIGNGQRYGIWLHEDSESKVVVGNIIYNEKDQYSMPYGIRETGTKNIIAKNKISHCRKEGILSRGISTLVVDNEVERGVNVENQKQWQMDSDINPEWTREELVSYIKSQVEYLNKN